MMTTIQSLLQTSGTGAAVAAQSTKTPAGSEDRFLKMLVAQLKNQDPLNPMDNAEVTSQMAQISTVSGVQQLNTTLQAMSGQINAAQPLQAASVVGRQVLVSGSSLQLAGDAAIGGFSLEQPVDQLTIIIRDASGAILHQADLGPQQSGMHNFEWDGIADNGQRAVNGMYSFSAIGTAAGKKVDAQLLSFARVDGVNAGVGELTLNLGGYGNVKLSEVRQIF